MELVGGNAVDGRDGAAEHMVGAVVAFGLLDGVDVERLLDDEDGGFVAFGVAVELRDFFVGVDESKSDRAVLDARVEYAEGAGDVEADARAVLEKIISIAFGRARTDAGEMTECFNRILQCFWQHTSLGLFFRK